VVLKVEAGFISTRFEKLARNFKAMFISLSHHLVAGGKTIVSPAGQNEDTV
jgi:hypothetical protein